MTIKKGQAKIVGSAGGNMTRTTIFNIVEKIDGAYVETLSELVSMVVEEVYGDSSYVVDSATEAGSGYKVYPFVSAAQRVDNAKNNDADIVTWITPLTEV